MQYLIALKIPFLRWIFVFSYVPAPETAYSEHQNSKNQTNAAYPLGKKKKKNQWKFLNISAAGVEDILRAVLSSSILCMASSACPAHTQGHLGSARREQRFLAQDLSTPRKQERFWDSAVASWQL